MGTVHKLLPKLTLNRRFIQDFLAATAPCFAMGIVEERKKPLPFLAIRTATDIPDHVTGQGFNFGHTMLAIEDSEIVHFIFEFYNFHFFNVLINPSNPIAQAVISSMIGTGEYFFLAVGPGGSSAAFRTEYKERSSLPGIEPLLPRILRSKTTQQQYDKAIKLFSKKPDPVGTVLIWVCHDDVGYLDLSGEVVEFGPK